MWNALADFWLDIRYATRTLRRSPGFAAVALLSLSLGIGANTAIFSLINTLTLRMLPVPEPRQLVEFLVLYPGDPPLNVFSWQSYEYFRDHNPVFSGITAVWPSRLPVRGEGLEPETVVVEAVAGNFFNVLGVKPAIGRLISAEDSAVAVVSWSCWKNQFNLDPAVLGKRILVQDKPLTVVGVAPRAFSGLQVGVRPAIWVSMDVEQPAQAGRPMQLIARMRPGVSIEQARAAMAVLFRWTLAERISGSKDPVMRQLKFEVQPAGAGLTTGLRDRFVKPLWALMAVVGLLLLIACINLANMLLARGAARRHEMAVRVALGAGRFGLMRLVLSESLLLSAAGALLGIVLASFGADALVRVITSGRQPPGPPLEIQVHLDVHVLVFAAAVALLTALLFGLAPAWNAFASGPASALRESGRPSDTRLGRFFGQSLVVAQVALSVGLVSAAGLFLRNLSNLEYTDLGFRRDHVLLVSLDPTHSGLSAESLSRAYQDLLARFARIPGVRSATISGPGPLSGAGAGRLVTVEGHPERPVDRRYVAVWWVAPQYFETLGIPLLAGRGFSAQDQGGPRVALINRTFARYYFNGRNPLGEHVTFDGDATPFEIVGVTGDAKYYEIREAAPRTIYLDTFQSEHPESGFALRTAVAPEAVAAAVRKTVRESLKDVPVLRITTLADQVDASIVPERLIAMLSGTFGALGSLLAAIGIYGVLAYTVSRRIHEIGIRMALGATSAAVSRMVLSEALAMSGVGLVIGVMVAFWAGRLAVSLMPDLPVKGAFPIALGALVMIAITIAAAYLPARRAARVDPMVTLRHE